MNNKPYRIDQYYKYTLQESHELNKAHNEPLWTGEIEIQYVN